ncbi:MAG: hypothetical protein ABI289_10420 [Candidatus Dormibacter sp.]
MSTTANTVMATCGVISVIYQITSAAMTGASSAEASPNSSASASVSSSGSTASTTTTGTVGAGASGSGSGGTGSGSGTSGTGSGTTSASGDVSAAVVDGLSGANAAASGPLTLATTGGGLLLGSSSGGSETAMIPFLLGSLVGAAGVLGIRRRQSIVRG